MKLFQSIIAAALVVMAGNMTYANFAQPSSATATVAETHVVQVIRKFSTWYDAYGAGSSGFLVKDGPSLNIVEYDGGSMLDKVQTPQYFLMTTFANGKVAYTPIEVR